MLTPSFLSTAPYCRSARNPTSSSSCRRYGFDVCYGAIDTPNLDARLPGLRFTRLTLHPCDRRVAALASLRPANCVRCHDTGNTLIPHALPSTSSRSATVLPSASGTSNSPCKRVVSTAPIRSSTTALLTQNYHDSTGPLLARGVYSTTALRTTIRFLDTTHPRWAHPFCSTCPTPALPVAGPGGGHPALPRPVRRRVGHRPGAQMAADAAHGVD